MGTGFAIRPRRPDGDRSSFLSLRDTDRQAVPTHETKASETMRQLTFLSPGRFEWQDVSDPKVLTPFDAVVRPLTVARCDLDLYIATGVIRYPGPFAFGHETIAEVVEAGEKSGVTPGERVVVPFQLSCGRCRNCVRGLTNACMAFPFGAAYGLKPTSGTEFGGALSDLLHVPHADHMLVKLPDNVDPVAAASVSDNIADGWRAVEGPLASRPGGTVLVIGGLAQSVGLYAAGAAVTLGASRVLYLDDDAARRERAVAMGATAETLGLDAGRAPKEQFDVVVEAAGNSAALAFGIQSCGPNGYLTSVSIHLEPQTPIPLTRAYYKGLTLHTGRVNSRTVFPNALRCIACGDFHAGRVTHRVLPFASAPDAMADAGPKLVFVSEAFSARTAQAQ
jgi:alcohol dehydrogenase